MSDDFYPNPETDYGSLHGEFDRRVQQRKEQSMTKRKRKGRWEKAGDIGVDAGLCWVGDPCYCVTPDATDHPAKTWNEFCAKLRSDGMEKDGVAQWNYAKGHPGLGVSVHAGYGDGFYPVYVRRAANGRIAEMRVTFIEQEPKP